MSIQGRRGRTVTVAIAVSGGNHACRIDATIHGKAKSRVATDEVGLGVRVERVLEDEEGVADGVDGAAIVVRTGDGRSRGQFGNGVDLGTAHTGCGSRTRCKSCWTALCVVSTLIPCQARITVDTCP
jgi:hypothetical protein